MSVALFASLAALVSESWERLPPFSVSPIADIEDVQLVIAVQRPPAHSVAGEVSLLLLRAAAAGGEERSPRDDRSDEGAATHPA